MSEPVLAAALGPLACPSRGDWPLACLSRSARPRNLTLKYILISLFLWFAAFANNRVWLLLEKWQLKERYLKAKIVNNKGLRPAPNAAFNRLHHTCNKSNPSGSSLPECILVSSQRKVISAIFYLSSIVRGENWNKATRNFKKFYFSLWKKGNVFLQYIFYLQ